MKRSMSTSILLRIGIGVVLWVAVWGFLSVRGSLSIWAWGAFLLPGLPVLIAIALVVGWRRRVGTASCCTKCGHTKNSDKDDADYCLECGAPWGSPGGVAKGRRRPVPSWVPWFAVLSQLPNLIVVCAHLYGRGESPYLPLHLFPTADLIKEVEIGELGTGYEAWLVAKDRDLTPEQVVQLVEAMFAAEERRGIMLIRQYWLDELSKSRPLPPDIIERSFQRTLSLSIVAPERVELGETFTVGVKGHGYGPPDLRNQATAVYVSGFFVGESSEPQARQGTVLDPRDLRGYPARSGQNAGPIEITVVADRPGPLRVRLVAWIAVVDRRLGGQPITWRDDGTPVISDHAIWSRCVETEHVTQVLEGQP